MSDQVIEPWRIDGREMTARAVGAGGEFISGHYIAREDGSRIAVVWCNTCSVPTEELGLQHAKLIAAAPTLLSELEKAHRIIRNALNLMTTDQKVAWSEANERDDVHGEGVTRANEREAAIAGAKP